jgi:leader peptidase (prepilin peptidase)/N-methyltransferase
MLVSLLPAWVVRAMAFVFGAIWGSFFNVAIYRWPRDMSVVAPPSHCPACQTPIPASRNVPILAYLVQRGRAACCGAPLSPRYLLVEVISAVLAVAIAERFVVRADPDFDLGLAALEAMLWFAFVGGLLIAAFVDLEWMEIPDEVTVGGTALALATVSFRSGIPLEEIALGAGGGYLAVQLLLVWGWERLTREPGMGEGDAKLVMLIGAFLGWRGALFALVGGCVQGIVAYVIARAVGARLGPGLPPELAEAMVLRAGEGPVAERVDLNGAEHASPNAVTAGPHSAATEPRTSTGTGGGPDLGDAEPNRSGALGDGDGEPQSERWIPFGPFLALAAIEFLFFGDAIVTWYLGLFE